MATYVYRINERIHAAAATPPPPQQAPTVTTLAATSVGQTSATLRGTANPHGANALAWFEWGTDAALSTFTSTAQQSIGNGSSALTVTASLSGLSAGTTYYYRVAANNAAGTTRGSIVSFSSASAGGAPTVFTRAAGTVSERSAILYGDFTNNGAQCTVWFEWGTDPALATFSSTSKDSNRYKFPDWSANIPTRHFEKCGTGIHNPATLTIGQTYYYRICASNANGTTKGNIVSFTPATITVTHTSQRYNHSRFHAIDHRTGGGPGRYGLTQALFDDECKWMAAHYDYVGNGALTGLKQFNPDMIVSPYLTEFWFVPVIRQAFFENAISNLGYDPELAYLHYAAGTSVAGYTHGYHVGNQTISSGGDGTVFPATVSDGSKTRANRVHAEQFQIQGYHYVNVGDPGFQAYRTGLINARMAPNAAGFTYDTLFLDSHSISLVTGKVPASTAEYAQRGSGTAPAPGTYWYDHHAFLTAERGRVNDNRVTINNAQRFNKTDERAFAAVAGGAFAEFINHPYRDPQWAAVLAYIADGTRLEHNTTKAHGRASIRAKSVGGCTGGNYPTVWDRTLMWELVSSITMYDPSKPDLYFVSPSIEAWEHPLYACWLPAFEYDIGAPLSPRAIYTTGGGPGSGSDPTGQSYTIYTRETANARVFIRGVTGGSQTNYADATAVTRNLPTDHTYRMLNEDGSLSAPVTSFTIRHGEALIFIKG